MATTWKAPTWRMPNDKNQNKFESYSLEFSGLVREDIQLGTTTFLLPGQPSSTSTSVSNPKFSASIFFNFNSSVTGTIAYMIGAGQAGGATYWNLRKNTSDNLEANFRITNGAYATIAGGTTLSHSTWYHACVTWDGNNINLYLNGVSDATQVAATTFYYSSTISHPTIGSFRYSASATANEWEGKLSQAAVFDYALSSDQIASLYNSGSPINPMTLKPAPIASYLLGENASTGGSNTLSVPNVAVPDASVFDFANSATDFISSDVNITGDWSVSMWVNTDSTSYQTALQLSSSASTGTQDSIIFVRNTFESNKWGFYDGSTVLLGSVLDINKWHNLMLTKNGTTYTLFLNGTQESQSTKLNINITDLLIGKRSFSGFFFDGQISNVVLWNSDQTTEISNIYNSGVPATSYTNTPTAWYKLDQSANWEADTVGDWQIPDAVSAYPQSFDFDGSRIKVSNQSLGITNEIAISAWVKIPNGSTGGASPNIQQIVSEDSTSGTSRNWNLSWRGGGYKDFSFAVFHSDGTATSIYSNVGDINDGKWHHVVGTWDGTTNANAFKIYVDNVATSTTSTKTDIRATSNVPTTIGAIPNTFTWAFDGNISNVQIWDTSLNSSQIETLYNNGRPLTTAIATNSLKGWWKLDNTEFYDTFNTTNKWMINNNGLSNNFNKCFWMNPLAIEVSSTLGYQDGTNAFSGAAWVNISSGNTYIISRQRGRVSSTGANPGWSFKTTSSGSAQGDPYFELFTNGNGTIKVKSLSYTLQDGNWHFVAFTYDGSQDVSGVKLYVDGYEDTSRQVLANDMTGTIPDYNTPFMIGGTYNRGYSGTSRIGTNQFMSNAMYFESELSASDILTLYNNGVPLNDLSSFTTVKGWWKLDDTATYGTGWTVPDASGNGNTGTSDTTMPITNRVDFIPAISNGVSSGMTEQNLVNNNVSALNGESSGMDTSNLVTSTLTRQVPYNSYSLNFDSASSDYINIGAISSINSTSSCTISYWCKKASASGNDMVVGSQITSTNGIWLQWFTDNNIYFSPRNGGLNFVSVALTGDTNWHHLVGVYDGTNMSIYIDGSEAATSTTSVPASLSATAGDNFQIGAIGTSFFTDGSISNVSIFDEALTSTEVLKLYNSSVPGNLSSFNPSPIAWWSLGSDSYYNGNNWICPDLIGSNNGTSVNMDDDALVGNAPNSTANGTSTNMTIDANLTGNAPNSSNNSFSVNMSFDDRETDVPS